MAYWGCIAPVCTSKTIYRALTVGSNGPDVVNGRGCLLARPLADRAVAASRGTVGTADRSCSGDCGASSHLIQSWHFGAGAPVCHGSRGGGVLWGLRLLRGSDRAHWLLHRTGLFSVDGVDRRDGH